MLAGFKVRRPADGAVKYHPGEVVAFENIKEIDVYELLVRYLFGMIVSDDGSDSLNAIGIAFLRYDGKEPIRCYVTTCRSAVHRVRAKDVVQNCLDMQGVNPCPKPPPPPSTP